MDPSTLAAELVKILVPFFIAGGAEIAKGAAGKVGENVVAQIWEKLRPKVQDSAAVKKIVQDPARANDPRVQNALEFEIEDVLKEDTALANELQILIVQGDYNAVNLGAGSQAQQIAVGREIQQTIYNYYQSAPGHAALDDKQFARFLSEYQVWIGNTYNLARLYGLEAIQAEHKQRVRSLGDVFVPLTLRQFAPLEREEIETLAKFERDKPAQRQAYLELVRHKRETNEPIALKNLLLQNQRLAIIGGAGCGKSTLLAFLAASLSVNAQQGAPLPFALPQGVKTLVPLIIPLRFFRKYQETWHAAPTERLHDKGLGTLAGFIKDYLMRRSAALRLSEDFFDRLLLGGGCLVMLDGLDEVVSRHERGRVKQLIEDLVHQDYPKNHYIVTAREAGYQQEAVFSQDDFARFDVQPLERDEIAFLVEKWCLQLYPNAVEDKTQELMAAIDDLNARRVEQNLDPLISTPLMTTMVVSVSFGEKKLPHERAKLYEAAVTVILQAQYLRDDVDDAQQDLINWGGSWEEQRDWLEQLALEMHKGGSAGAAVDEERVRDILRPTLASDKLEQFIKAVRLRGGLFQEVAESFQFVHLTFQEFLAARRLTKQRKDAWAELAPRLADSWWRETLLLLYGFARVDWKEYAEQYLEWLSTQPNDSPRYLAGLELAGAAVLELEIPNLELQAQQAKLVIAAIENHGTIGTGILRANAGNVLARLDDKRAGVGVNENGLPDLLFCEISAGDFIMGDTLDDYGGKKEITYAKLDQPYYITRYPITNAQFDAFVADENGYRKNDWWTQAGLKWRGNRTANEKYGGVFDLPNHPVVNVRWYEAVAFCRWMDDKLKAKSQKLKVWRNNQVETFSFELLTCHLPTEAEWEKAARTRDGRKYPWGPTITTEHANYDDTGIGATSAVGCFPKGTNEYGVLDMSGNVWEWCATKWVANYQEYDNQEDNRLEGESTRVLRGGAFNYNVRSARCAFRLNVLPHSRNRARGFRVVLAPV
jgi:formylglycine-generating enzyme required for sulfatase activity/energy-coupling factor transporter ATP-binding protein EcfA2